MVYYIKYISEEIAMERLINRPNFQYVYEIPKDSSTKYKELCEWMYRSLKEDEKIARDNNLYYSYKSIEKLEIQLQRMNDQRNDINVFLRLKDIEYMGNKSNFDEFIEDIKFEYELFVRKNDYDYFNRVLSWYKIKQQFIESTMNFLSRNKLDLDELNFKSEFNQYNSEILETKNRQGELKYVKF